MTPFDETIQPLREALAVSPDNLPLRQHLAETLLARGYLQEAAQEFQAALAKAPKNRRMRMGLAGACLGLGQDTAARRIVEALLAEPEPFPHARILYARLLLRSGEAARAEAEYRRAVSEDAALADPALAGRLGLRPERAPARKEDPAAGVEDLVNELRPAPRPGQVSDFARVRAQDVPSGVADLAERPDISFADVGGMEGLKDEIRMKIILPLQRPELCRAYGKPAGGSILMYGPPGCGKTLLARAAAGEAGAAFISVGINDVLDMWLGQSERNLHDVFKQARRARPCILFFDEVDALGASRTDMRQNCGRQVINQFLSELDGASSSNEGVLVLGATNAPWHMDPAFRRPGRFDRVVFVPPPDMGARAAVLRVLLRGRPSEAVDHDAVARAADGFTGADLKAVVDAAVEARLKEAMETGRIAPLRTADLLAAAAGARPTSREWFSTARNYATYANQGGLYDDILDRLGDA